MGDLAEFFTVLKNDQKRDLRDYQEIQDILDLLSKPKKITYIRHWAVSNT